MSYDSFWTVSYAGGFIHGKREIATCKIVITFQLPGDYTPRHAGSYRAAQLALTNHARYLKMERTPQGGDNATTL